MKKKLLLYYVGGSILWLLLLSLMPATQDLTSALILSYATLTLGFALGIVGQRVFERWPWLLLLIPGLPLVLGIFF